MLLYKVVFEDIIRTKYKPGTGIMAAIKILRIEGNWGRSSCLRFTPAGWCAGKACLPQMAQKLLATCGYQATVLISDKSSLQACLNV